MAHDVQTRLQKLRLKLKETGLDGMFVSQADNRYYLSGFLGTAGSLFITAGDTVLATDFRYVEQAAIQAPRYRIFQITGSSHEWFAKLTKELDIKRLGFESGDITCLRHKQLSDSLRDTQSGLELVPTDSIVESIRVTKEPGEMDLIAQAAAITDRAVDHAREVLREGITEKYLAWEIEKFLRENGSQSVPFEVIVASGPNSALPHARPSDRKINRDEPVVIDIGAKVGGYCSDLTRTLCLETETGGTKFHRVYDVVLQAQSAAMSAIRHGMTGHYADAAARKVIEDAGFGTAFGHSLGHGVGLDVHEQPRLGQNSKDVLTDGMVFTVEPGIYLTGWGGIRIEDLVRLENGKIKSFSKALK